MKATDRNIDDAVGKCLIDIRQGNTQSIAELFELTYRGLFSVAMKYCRHTMTAEDLVAEIFANIQYIAEHYKSGYKAFNYLCKALKNKYLNMKRGEKVRSFAPLNENIIATKENIDEKVSSIAVREGLKLLDEEEYLIIYYKFYFDMTFREIANNTDKSLGAIQRIYKKAVAKLKDYL